MKKCKFYLCSVACTDFQNCHENTELHGNNLFQKKKAVHGLPFTTQYSLLITILTPSRYACHHAVLRPSGNCAYR